MTIPTSVGSSILIFAAILTTLSAVAGVIVAGAAVVFEVVAFYAAGQA